MRKGLVIFFAVLALVSVLGAGFANAVPNCRDHHRNRDWNRDVNSFGGTWGANTVKLIDNTHSGAHWGVGASSPDRQEARDPRAPRGNGLGAQEGPLPSFDVDRASEAGMMSKPY